MIDYETDLGLPESIPVGPAAFRDQAVKMVQQRMAELEAQDRLYHPEDYGEMPMPPGEELASQYNRVPRPEQDRVIPFFDPFGGNTGATRITPAEQDLTRSYPNPFLPTSVHNALKPIRSAVESLTPSAVGAYNTVASYPRVLNPFLGPTVSGLWSLYEGFRRKPIGTYQYMQSRDYPAPREEIPQSPGITWENWPTRPYPRQTVTRPYLKTTIQRTPANIYANWVRERLNSE